MKSKELLAFKKHFERRTAIKVIGLKENKEFSHWKRLELANLDSNQIITVGSYLNDYLNGNGSLGTFNHSITLTLDEKFIKKFITYEE